MKRLEKQDKIKIGKQIHSARTAAGMTQERLAEAVDVIPQAISDMERGVTAPSVRTLMDLSGVLGVSCDYLLGIALPGGTAPDETEAIIERLRRLPPDQAVILRKGVIALFEALRAGGPGGKDEPPGKE